MILLADRIAATAPPDQETIGGLDVTVRRNAFGRQVDSFEADLDVDGRRRRRRSTRCSSARRGSRRSAPGVDGRSAGSRPARPPVGSSRSGRANLLATSFHPELTGDPRVHALFVDLVRQPDEPSTSASRALSRVRHQRS